MWSPADSYAPHMLLIIWVFNENRNTRHTATRLLTTMCSRITGGCRAFYQEVCSGLGGSSKITRALIRDFKDEQTLGDELNTMALLTFFLRSNKAEPIKLETALDQDILWTLLSACRRQLCMGDGTAGSHESVGLSTFAFVK